MKVCGVADSVLRACGGSCVEGDRAGGGCEIQEVFHRLRFMTESIQIVSIEDKSYSEARVDSK